MTIWRGVRRGARASGGGAPDRREEELRRAREVLEEGYASAVEIGQLTEEEAEEEMAAGLRWIAKMRVEGVDIQKIELYVHVVGVMRFISP